LSKCDRRVVAGLHDHALDEGLDRDLRADLRERTGAFGLPGVLADHHGLFERQPLFRERLEHDVTGHELRDARRLHLLLGIARGDHASAVLVDEHVRARVERRRFRNGNRGMGRRNEKDERGERDQSNRHCRGSEIRTSEGAIVRPIKGGRSV
jgi:hypothetical protein